MLLQEAGAARVSSSERAEFVFWKGVGLLMTGRSAKGSSNLRHVLVYVINVYKGH